jgi:hypothetical protein
MYRRSQIAALLAVSCAALAGAPAPANRILGVAEAGKPFLVGSVETKPEAGPVPVVDGDRVQALGNAVSFRLDGQNRAVLPANSTVGLRRYGADGVNFYLTEGSIRFEARKQPLAICALNRLYVPSIAAAGEVAIEDSRVQVRMTTGVMLQMGTAACGGKFAPPVSMTETPGSATATATTASAGATSSAATVGSIALAAGATAGLASTIAVASSAPPAESPINPAQ